MPRLPKGRSRPWIPKRPQHMREVDNASFYNSKRWRSLRNYYIQKFPLCFKCKKEGVVTGAQVVDHIVPLTMGGSPVDQKNLQSLCTHHHAQKSGRESAEKRNNIKIYNREKRNHI